MMVVMMGPCLADAANHFVAGDDADVVEKAIEAVEQSGIVVIDEIDKVAVRCLAPHTSSTRPQICRSKESLYEVPSVCSSLLRSRARARRAEMPPTRACSATCCL